MNTYLFSLYIESDAPDSVNRRLYGKCTLELPIARERANECLRCGITMNTSIKAFSLSPSEAKSWEISSALMTRFTHDFVACSLHSVEMRERPLQ
jgi:hypothetical protein